MQKKKSVSTERKRGTALRGFMAKKTHDTTSVHPERSSTGGPATGKTRRKGTLEKGERIHRDSVASFRNSNNTGVLER